MSTQEGCLSKEGVVNRSCPLTEVRVNVGGTMTKVRLTNNVSLGVGVYVIEVVSRWNMTNCSPTRDVSLGELSVGGIKTVYLAVGHWLNFLLHGVFVGPVSTAISSNLSLMTIQF